MRLQDLDYQLPAELIAQHPAPRREDSRLLVVERSAARLHDSRFADLPRWLASGDTLVVNETRVIHARLVMRRRPPAGSGAAAGGAVEVMLVRPEGDGRWRVLARPSKRAPLGGVLETEDGGLALEVVAVGEDGERVVQVTRGELAQAMRERGEVPLPPYIHRAPTAEDRERYQTVYARTEGAVAAPTAGLHFTRELLDRLAAAGVASVPVLLHVGPGTFRPIRHDDPAQHRMDEEWYEVSEAAAGDLTRRRAAGGRLIAVGTTSVRALESACDARGGEVGAARGWTRKFILPPYRFQAVDALLTNFHLPRTSLLLLVAAFAGEELLMRAYAHAVRERYRFYSYGDAMLIV
jgi:S-adenosylmethionine:tRNA ribosyltransferase-isomerase